MPFILFSVYTFLGAALWSATLVLLGYFLGGHEELIKEYVHELVYVALALVIVIASVYTYFHKRSLKKQ
jgi:membrane protein DedA with SNARE-associated domain